MGNIYGIGLQPPIIRTLFLGRFVNSGRFTTFTHTADTGAIKKGKTTNRNENSTGWKRHLERQPIFNYGTTTQKQ